MEATEQEYRGQCVIYYSYKAKILRYRMNIRWDDRNKSENRKKINTTKGKINALITEYYNQNTQKPETDWLKDQIDKPNKLQSKEILPLLKEFVDSKRGNIKDQSLKDWTNLLTSIERWNKVNGTLYVSDINVKFYSRFQYFMSQSYTVTTKFGKILHRGGLNSNTIRKRVVIFNAFLKEYSIPVPSHKDYSLVKGYDTDFQILTPAEIRILYDMELTGVKEKVKCIMVILCLTGLRYSDYETLEQHHIKDNCIIKNAVKTDEKFVIPIHSLVREIFNKYSYTGKEIEDMVGVKIVYPLPDQRILKLPRINHTVFNREIKLILKDVPAFQEAIVVNEKTYNKVTPDLHRRYNLISSHTGRHSFISNLIINGETSVTIADMTGHKPPYTVLAKYYKKFSKNNQAVIDKMVV